MLKISQNIKRYKNVYIKTNWTNTQYLCCLKTQLLQKKNFENGGVRALRCL